MLTSRGFNGGSDSWLLTLILADILFLPVLPVVHVPVSLLICVGIVLVQRDSIDGLKSVRAHLLVVLLSLSMVVSWISKPSKVEIDNGVLAVEVGTHMEDAKRLIALLAALLIYVCVRHIMSQGVQPQSLRWVLSAFLAVVVVIYALFLVSYDSFAALRSVMFGVDVNLQSYSQLQYSDYFTRFSFIFLDPNNAAYFLLMIAIFGIHNLTGWSVGRLFCLLLILAVPFATKSLGAAMAAGTYLIILCVFLLLARRTAGPLLALVGVLSTGIALFLIDRFNGGQLVQDLAASQSDVLRRWESNSATTRTDYWRELLATGFPPVVGSGYVLIRGGLWFSPHSDHLRVLYSYGILVYVLLVREALHLRLLSSRWFFLIPVMFAFSINSVIDEPRFMYAVVVLVAITKGANLPGGGSRQAADARFVRSP